MNRYDCPRRSGLPSTHSKIEMNRLHQNDWDGGTCSHCRRYVRRMSGDYRWAATILIEEWP